MKSNRILFPNRFSKQGILEFFLIFILFLQFSLNTSLSGQINQTLVIQDANTGQPVEGVLVGSRDLPLVLRSDRTGQVALPAVMAGVQLQLRSRNYQMAAWQSAAPSVDTVLLQPDSLRISSGPDPESFKRADTLRGSYGPYRANNDLLYYDLNIRLDIEKKYLSGYNTIRFKMLKDGRRIQIDLFANMNVDSIIFAGQPLDYQRLFNAVFVDFPDTLHAGETHQIDFHYSGHPKETGRFGGIAFKQDSLGNPWVYTACQGIGASLWWPNKDQQPDEVDSMRMRVAVPTGLTDVSNGRFAGKTDLGDGYTEFDWRINYPINNYCVSLNIGNYTHFSDSLDDLSIDYFVLPYHLEKAKRQFQQVKPMLVCFEKYLGEFPFKKDGFKLIEVPYSGMEHQTAVTYGNLFKNGYLGRDWTGVGVSLKFDFIIIHESGHEWFGNSVSANDVSDAWIHEGWCTYTEVVYAECMFGYDDAMKYVNGYRSKVKNQTSIIGPPSVNHWPTGDQYFKGALILNTLRHVVNDDARWWQLMRDYSEHFKYQNIYTSDVLTFFNEQFDRNFNAIFDQYLYHAQLPELQLKFDQNRLNYRWQAAVADFDMPVRLRAGDREYFVQPSAEWQSLPMGEVPAENWSVADEQFYVTVREKR